MPTDYYPLDIALADAANNCASDSSVRTTVTLRGGVQYTGVLRKDSRVHEPTKRLSLDNRGWVTILRSEIIAVESHFRR